MFTLIEKEVEEKTINKIKGIIKDLKYLDGQDPSKPFYIDPSILMGDIKEFTGPNYYDELL